MRFLKHLQNIYTCIPIDAKFYADFKNVYFCIPIMRIFRVMAIQRPKKARFGENGPFRHLNGHNLKSPHDRYIKVYIFEISIKFCVDWYAGIYILKMFQKSHLLAGGAGNRWPWEPCSPYQRPNMDMIR